MRLVALLLTLLALAPDLRAQSLGASVQRPEDIVQWTARIEGAAAERPALRLEARIADGWKVYALDSPPPSPPLRVSPVLPGGVEATGAAAHVTEPKEVFDPNFEATVRSFEHTFAVRVPLRIAPAAEARTVAADVRFTTCNPTICLPPKTVRVSATLPPVAASGSATTGSRASSATAGEGLKPSPTATATAAPPPSATAVTPPPSVPAPNDSASSATVGEGFKPSPTADASAVDTASVGTPAPPEALPTGVTGAFLLLAVGAGLAALLTPCVFPMLPLTVSFFSRASEGNPGRGVRQALLYGAAIVGTYTALGLLLALFVGAGGAGRLAANPWVNLVIGTLFVAFGLSLMGLFELRLPAAWVNRVDAASRTAGGAGGPLLMGLTLTLVAFSCTVPFVGALLAAAAQGAWLRPVVGMLAFSLTFAAPFVLLAMFPGALHRLPRSGAWMRTFAVTLGFVEMAAALKFLSSADLVWGWGVFTRPLVIALTAVLLAVAGLYLLGFVRMDENDAPRPAVGTARLAAAVAFLAAALYLIPGLFGANVGLFDAYLPPRRATDFSVSSAASAGTSHDDGWIVGQGGIARALDEAKATNRPVMIDFSGYTCTNCRYMEANVFPQPEVARALGGFVRLRLYTDDLEEGEALQRYQLETTGTVALPTYAILSPDGRLLAQHSGLASVAAFSAFLRRAS